MREALEFLGVVNADRGPSLDGQRVLVLGGGDTAMDCARSAVRLGAAAVTVAYRRAEQATRAAPKEVQAAREEGVRLLFHRRPRAIAGDERVSGVRFDTVEGEPTEPCDLAILAFGLVPSPPAWLARFGIAAEGDGRIRIDGQGRTTHPKVYAGGDATHGPDLVVTALAAGRRAAEAILDSFRLSRRVIDMARGWQLLPRNAGVPAPHGAQAARGVR